MKKIFCTNMLEDLKKEYFPVLEFIPIILALGITIGFGSYLTLFGVLIGTFVSILFYSKRIFYISVSASVFLGSINCILGGRMETLTSILFFSGLFLSFFSFIKSFKVNENLKNIFLSSLLFSSIVISIPLLLGFKTVSCLPLFLEYTFSPQIIEGDIISAFLFFALYYYFLKTDKFPPIFSSFLLTSFITFIWKIPTTSLFIGVTYLKFPSEGDFSNIYLLLFLSFLFAFVSRTYTKQEFNTPKNLFILGASTVISSLFGAVCASISNIKLKSFFSKLILLVIFSALVVNFELIFRYIPVCASASALLVYGLKLFIKTLKLFYNSDSFKSLNLKILFMIYFILSLISPPLGAFILFMTSISEKFYGKKD